MSTVTVAKRNQSLRHGAFDI